MANVALLSGFVTRVEHDDDHSTAPNKVQAVARTKVHSHFGDFAFDGLPVAKAACFRLPQTRCNANLSTLVPQGV